MEEIEIMNLLNRFFQPGWVDKRQMGEIDSPREFRAHINRERGRSDRHKREFSVILIETENPAIMEKCFFQLIKSLNTRLRSSDELGWFDTMRVGVLLPETSMEAARRVIEDIRCVHDEKLVPFTFRLYNYPNRWPAARRRKDVDDRDGSDRHRGGPEKVIKRVKISDHSDELHTFLASDLPWWKRMIDIFGSAAGLILLLFVFMVLGIYIKIVSPGPVFFKQVRLGRGQTPFTCLKFRTMKVRAETAVHENHLAELIQNADTPMGKLDSTDSRIIPLGRMIRKTGLDELPQLINVLKGEMSLIGPRPCLPNEADEYLPWHRSRFDTHPGLTGLWQVNGKNRTTFTQMIRYDVAYAKTKSFQMDVKILFKTIPAILQQFAGKSSERNL